MNTVAIVIACGREEEIAPGTEAAFLPMGNSPMLALSLRTLQATDAIDSVIVAVSKERVDATVHAIRRYGCTKVCGVVVGGSNRLATLRTVFAKLPGEPAIMVLHEASRPFAGRETFEETVKAARRYGCAIAAHKLPDAAKLAPKGLKAASTLDRNAVWTAQTPQAFKTEVLQKIVDSKAKNIKVVDDESEFVSKPAEVHLIDAGAGNMKIRTSKDLAVATALFNAHLLGP